MYLVYRIDCETCKKCVYSEYLNNYNETVSFSYEEPYSFDDYLYCNNCVRKCLKDDCNVYIIKCDNKLKSYYCECCEKCVLIKTTCNDITRCLPIELVDMIVEFLIE